ncbi:hypothetical protein NRB20_69610 [Nocardia sp. RB20]|uniref:Uncharacterized protein n=1 Tax=Nocardia macrotermitis TaxID=2585198 RepID=A0A7K0DDT2_9NOCA|nr:hypothetical protein [Nocardia macrotermitis]
MPPTPPLLWNRPPSLNWLLRSLAESLPALTPAVPKSRSPPAVLPGSPVPPHQPLLNQPPSNQPPLNRLLPSLTVPLRR